MIYFVDEDSHLLGAFTAELRMRGHAVELVYTARDALRTLVRVPLSIIDLVIIDVMLAPGDTIDDMVGATTTAGLSLLRDLAAQNPDAFPHRAVLFTGSIGEPYRAAAACAHDLNVELWEKSTFYSPVEFADRVEHLIERREGHA